MGGRNKAMLSIGGVRILDRVLASFRGLFEEVLLVSNDPLVCLTWDLPVMSDLFALPSSLTGIHTGLFYATSPHVFFAACDAPFLQPRMVDLLVGQIEPHWDVVVPRTRKGWEPVCAVYSRRCLRVIERRLFARDFRISDLFRRLRVKTVPEDVLRLHDPDLVSFFNINEPGQLSLAEAMWRGKEPRT